MKCPNCVDTVLVMVERLGVEIDYCPSCRGVWLDRGELDKLLDRASPAASPAPPAQAQRPHHLGRHRAFEDSDYGEHQRYPSGKRKSWLHEIFD